LQSDSFAAIPSLTLAPLTSELVDAPLLRLNVDPTPANGLKKPSQVMIDKVMTVPRSRVGTVLGDADKALVSAVGRALIRFLELDQD
jgi:mRNA interferase MazF